MTDDYLDCFSISYPELLDIFPEMGSVGEAVGYVKTLGCPVFLRNGEDGAYFVKDGKAFHSPMVTAFGTADPTGCGNASTSVAFMADTEGYDPLRVSYMGAVAAALNASYNGLIPLIGGEIDRKSVV